MADNSNYLEINPVKVPNFGTRVIELRFFKKKNKKKKKNNNNNNSNNNSNNMDKMGK